MSIRNLDHSRCPVTMSAIPVISEWNITGSQASEKQGPGKGTV